jgi:uncharacterized Zn finger protein (UPF0148 family)
MPDPTPLLKPNGQPTGFVMCPVCNAVMKEGDDPSSHHSDGEKRPTGEAREEAERSAEGLIHPELLSTPIASLHPEMTEEQLAVLNMEVPVVEEEHESRRHRKSDGE